jgi:hypothetical protein
MQVNIEFGGDAVTQIGTTPAHHAIALAVGTVFSHFAASLNWASARRGRRGGRRRSARVAKPSALARIPPPAIPTGCASWNFWLASPNRAASAGPGRRGHQPRMTPMAIARMRRAGLASAVRAAAAGNREIRRSWRAISMAGMLLSANQRHPASTHVCGYLGLPPRVRFSGGWYNQSNKTRT